METRECLVLLFSRGLNQSTMPKSVSSYNVRQKIITKTFSQCNIGHRRTPRESFLKGRIHPPNKLGQGSPLARETCATKHICIRRLGYTLINIRTVHVEWNCQRLWQHVFPGAYKLLKCIAMFFSMECMLGNTSAVYPHTSGSYCIHFARNIYTRNCIQYENK